MQQTLKFVRISRQALSHSIIKESTVWRQGSLPLPLPLPLASEKPMTLVLWNAGDEDKREGEREREW